MLEGLLQMPHRSSVIIEDRSTDYLFGANTKVVQNIFLPSLESWDRYFTPGEEQIGIYFDTLGCVTFSALNVVEAIFNYQIKHDMISTGNIEWLREHGYFDDNGYVNFSDRFTAKMSGTTHDGNSGQRVGDSIRKDGLVPERKWPYPNRQYTPVFVWEDFYKEIPQELIDLGKEFLKRFLIQYEITPTLNDIVMLQAYKNSPIQVFVHAWDNPVNDVFVMSDGAINHAVSAMRPKTLIRDHYKYKESFNKTLSEDFVLHYQGFKYTVTQINQRPMMRLIKGDKQPNVYAIDQQGRRRYIYDEVLFEKGFVKKLWGNWGTIETKPQAEVEAMPEASPIIEIMFDLV